MGGHPGVEADTSQPIGRRKYGDWAKPKIPPTNGLTAWNLWCFLIAQIYGIA